MKICAQLEEWASVNSYSYNSPGLERMLQLAESAFSCLQSDEMCVLPTGLSLSKRKHARFTVFLGGHLDTVFPPDHPFQTVTWLDSNRLQGPGVADMKAGILIMLHALLDFEASSGAEEI